MNMALAGGNAGAVGAALYSASSINNNFKPIDPVQTTFAQRTQGSVFGDLTHGAAGRQQSVASGGAVSNLLTGNFLSLTSPDKTGMVSSIQPQGKNDDHDKTKLSDEMLKIATNLDMKDMWAAA